MSRARIERSNTAGPRIKLDRLPVVAAELVRRQVTVIFATGGSAPALAAKAATKIIPIVFAVPEDPLRAALVDSLSRPGGNATGIYFFVADLVAKQLGLLRELVPGAARVAVLVNPVAAARAELDGERGGSRCSRALGCKSRFSTSVPAMRSMRPSVPSRASAPPHCSSAPIRFSPTGEYNSPTWRHATRFPHHMCVARPSQPSGPMSYGTNINDAYRQAGVYSGRILKGAKPADLPVVQSTKFELVINMQTATDARPRRASVAARPRRRGYRMKRREFISLGFAGRPSGGRGSLAATLRSSLERVRQIGVFMRLSESDPVTKGYLTALSGGLAPLGWSENRNLQFEKRLDGRRRCRHKTPLQRTLVRLNPDVILAHGTETSRIMQQHTRSDPARVHHCHRPGRQRAGCVVSARPGGNITGFTNFEFSMAGKWLELLQDVAPTVRNVTVLFNPDNAGMPRELKCDRARRTGAGITADRSVECATEARSSARSTGFALNPTPVYWCYRNSSPRATAT